MNKNQYPVHGSGLGLRRSMMDELADQPPSQVNFMEVAPENWISVGGALGKQFSAFTEKYPVTLHGLSLSIGSPAPLDEAFLYKIKKFIKQHNIPSYSDHLSYCSDDGHLYDLMPIPFTEEAVHYVAERIRRTQDILEQRIAMENISYYAAPSNDMSEIDFINAVISEADCDFLLDVNNIYVNSINHQYDAVYFLKQLPADRVTYLHIAGHYNEADDLIVDTHGANVVDPVWDLLHKTYEVFGVMPTLLERDFNIPPLADLLSEVDTIINIQNKWENQPASHSSHG
jgi:hypothetical protein